jgi:transcriptional regulator with XRE-family HTH domain
VRFQSERERQATPEQSSVVASRSDDGDAIRAIGAAIRELRTEQGLSLREFSKLTGFSIGFLSQVERGRSSLALTSLHKVAKALGTDVASLFPVGQAGEPHPLPHVTRADEHSEIAIAASQRTYKVLSGRAPNRVLEPLFVTIHPSERIEEAYNHEGEEFCYVLSGELRYVIDGTEYRLGQGDSIHFRATVPHAIQNDTDEPVEALWVLTPRFI